MSRSSLLTSFRLVALILGLCLVPSHSTAALLPPTPAAAVGDPLPCTDGWQTMQYRTIGGADSTLLDAVATSPGLFWGVGHTNIKGLANAQPLIQRWDGTIWQTFETPTFYNQLLYGSGVLKAVVAPSANDVWAVGFVGSSEFDVSAEAALILRWNGTNWSRMENTGSMQDIARLDDIVALSPNNLWVVGQDDNGSSFILRWDGTIWVNVPVPLIEGQTPFLSKITATANSELWVIGQSKKSGSVTPVVLRYSGSSWASFAVPNGSGGLYAISASPDGSVWIAGSDSYPTALRWNGSQLELIPIARSLAPPGFETQSLIANASNDVWLLGYSGQSALLHWDGVVWEQMAHPSYEGYTHRPKALLTPAPGELWIMGNLSRKALAERYLQPTLTIGSGNISPGPTGRAAQFALTLSHVSPISVTLDLRTEDAGAVAGRDYIALNTTVTIPACTKSITVRVQLTDGATPPEDAAIKLMVSNPRGAALGSLSTQSVVITPPSNTEWQIYLPLTQLAPPPSIIKGRLAFVGGNNSISGVND